MLITLCIYTGPRVKAPESTGRAEPFLLHGWGEKCTQRWNDLLRVTEQGASDANQVSKL